MQTSLFPSFTNHAMGAGLTNARHGSLLDPEKTALDPKRTQSRAAEASAGAKARPHGAMSFDSEFSRLQYLELTRGAWVEMQQHWLSGDAELFAQLADETRWLSQDRWMYERRVAVPRLLGAPLDGTPADRLLKTMAAVLSERYQRDLSHLSLAWYRDGRDSVAMHGDKVGREINGTDRHEKDTVIATVSLGGPRTFLLRPVNNEPIALRGKVDGCTLSRSHIKFRLGWGDLLVMGGTCQKTWLHGVPKVARANPRISVMFREEGVQ